MARGFTDDEVRRVVETELELLTRQVRSSSPAVEELLHPDFVEFGASGRRWDRAEIVEVIAGEGHVDIAATEVTGARLAEDVVLVTYVAHHGDTRSRRSSVWRRAGDGPWRLYFHQGTPNVSS